jgi:hypothetical protein
MENYIFKSNLNIFKVVVSIYLIFFLLFLIYALLGFNDFRKGIWIIFIIDIVLNFFLSFYFVSIHYFYEDQLLIKYPTRIVKRVISINYTEISKTKFIKAPRGTMLFIIFFNYRGKGKTSSFNLRSREKMKLLFSFLYSKNINIELNIWGQISLYKGGNLPKF